MADQQHATTRDDHALRDSPEFLRSSLDAIAGHIAVLDESGTILEVNESWRRFAGDNQFVGPSFGVGTNYFEPCETDVPTPHSSSSVDGREIARGIREVIARERESFEAEYPCHSPTQERWFIMRATRFQGPGPVRVVVVHDNVTERKQEELARDRMARHFADHVRVFDQLLSSLKDFAYTFDLEGRFTFANKPLLDLWGLTLEQAMGKNFIELHYPPDLAAQLKEQIRYVIATKNSFRGETPYTAAAGTTGYYQYIFSPVLNAEGKVEAVAGSTRDITTHHRTEEKLTRLIADRERSLAAERTTRAEAEAANRAKDRFLAVLSHELRTPLTPIVMTVAAMELDGTLPAVVRDQAKMIRRNVELEVKLIDDLLDLSRITSGKLSLERHALDLNDLICHVCEMCQSNVREKGIRVHCNLDEHIGNVVGDSARLHQVVWNLLNNAVKFTPDHGQITLTTCAVDGRRARITVTDTGIGIPPDILPRIFDAFEQGDARITQQFGGMGLGLAISKFLVEEHGGTIAAQTLGKDQGSSFIVELPMSPKVVVETSPTSEPKEEPKSSGLHLLVVEDHPDTVKVLGMMLSLAGHTVKTAMNGQIALELLDQNRFDIVVSDLGLPDMTGYDLMQRIKTKHAVKGICMSGYGMESDLKKSAAAGFAAHLVKPVNFAKLEEMIRTVANT